MSKRIHICREGTRFRATHLPSGVYYNYHTTKPMSLRHAIDMAIKGLVLGMYECHQNLLEKYLVNKQLINKMRSSPLKEVLATRHRFVEAVPKSTNAPNLYVAAVFFENSFGKHRFELRDLFVQELTEE